ncbi:MAG: T9SS type A sorting domain-containing protein [Candidatus Marinimicrobia bacterium]|nr:T9SS type A sorting domain-containing protein [Candidatus Neomarinimicrobiota bacterium]
MKKFILFILLTCAMVFAEQRYAGFRASRVMPGNFPEPLYWSKVGHIIADKFEEAQPAGVWIVSTYWGNGLCRLHFPHPGNGKNYEHISFDTRDLNEPYLDLFDSTGVRVWLQVESGDADMDSLISLVMDRYKHHQCVIGFGVDNEWYFNSAANDYCGRKVSDGEAERWETAVKSYNSEYTLTLKHWDTDNMPPNYRGNLVFVDDSQDFGSMNSMVNEFKYWGNYYKNNPVIFQFGYNSDVDNDGDSDFDWWGGFDDPVKTIGNELFSKISNCLAIYWVDFTIKDLFPINDVLTKIDRESEVIVEGFQLQQNYPNPFNGNTTIGFQINQPGHVKLQVFDLQGRLVKSLVEEILPVGKYQYYLSVTDFSTGIYFYQLINDENVQSRTMLVLK